MRGSIIKRSEDSYRIAVSLGKGPDGKYKQHFETVTGNKKDAERRLRELLSSLDNGTYSKPGKQTVADYLEQWLKDYAYPNLSPRTAEGYAGIIKGHLIPAFGKVHLAELRPDMIQRYYTDKLTTGRYDGKGGLSARTVRHHHMCLHGALKNAVKMGLLMRNPVEAVTAPRPTGQEMHTLDETQAETIMVEAMNTPYYALFSLALYTGMRRSELLALRWQDIDLIMAEASVSRSSHRLLSGEFIIRGTKTAKSSRTVALSPNTCLILRQHLANEMALCGRVNVPFTNDRLLFCQWDGKPLLPHTVSQAWRRLTRRLGILNIRFHDLRHTHATLMLKQGISPKIVQERLGHSSITTTMDVYSHVMPGMQRKAAESFDGIFAKA